LLQLLRNFWRTQGSGFLDLFQGELDGKGGTLPRAAFPLEVAAVLFFYDELTEKIADS
jgi:hypothetical protein